MSEPVTRDEWRIVYPDGLSFDGYDYDVSEDIAGSDGVVEHRTVTTTTTPWTRVTPPEAGRP